MIHIDQIIHLNCIQKIYHPDGSEDYNWERTTPTRFSSYNDIHFREGGKWQGEGQEYTIIDIGNGQYGDCYLWKGSRENFIKQLLAQADKFQVNIIDEY